MKVSKICFQCKKTYITYLCNVKHSIRTFCSSTCYGHWQKGKHFSEQNKHRNKIIRKCKVSGCDRCYFGKEYCKYHYYRFVDRPKKPLQLFSPRLIRIKMDQKNIEKIPKSKLIELFIFIIKKRIKHLINILIGLRICQNCKNIFFITYRFKQRFCSHACSSLFRKKEFIICRGYKKVLLPFHYRSSSKGYVFEHIVIMENKIGRQLTKNEVVHHIDGNKQNNAPENLMLFKNNSEHMQFHRYHLEPVNSGADIEK